MCEKEFTDTEPNAASVAIVASVAAAAERLFGGSGFLASHLFDELSKKNEVKKIKQKIKLIKETDKGPSLEKLNEELIKTPGNLDVVFKITDTHFANNNFDSCFDMLLNYYPKNKEKIKTKMLGYFDVLGFEHESTILYRKKLSSIMFS